MTIHKATPYLFFDGTAEAAVRLYEKALGAKTEALQRYADVPGGAAPSAPEDKGRVMHALLRVGGAELMVSDMPHGRPSPVGSNVQVCLDYDDVAEMTRAFDALAATGKVIMGLHDTFWGAKFGALVDAFGIPWMFNCTTAPR